MQHSDLDQELSTLKHLLRQNSVKTGKQFRLASGAVSSIYVDAKRTTCTPLAMPLVGRAFLRKIAGCNWSPQAVGGKTLGADPIAYSIARESLDTGPAPINAFIVRKEPKKHGTEQYIEGLLETSGIRVVIVDDVCTRGGSTGEAIERATQAGMVVLGAVCLVDREEGAKEFLADKYHCRLESIFKLSELVSHGESEALADPVGTHP